MVRKLIKFATKNKEILIAVSLLALFLIPNHGALAFDDLGTGIGFVFKMMGYIVTTLITNVVVPIFRHN